MKYQLNQNYIDKNILPFIALAGSFVALLYVFYIMQSLSYSYGIVLGMASMINSFNITVSQHVLNIISNAATIKVTLKIVDILLFVGCSLLL